MEPEPPRQLVKAFRVRVFACNLVLVVGINSVFGKLCCLLDLGNRCCLLALGNLGCLLAGCWPRHFLPLLLGASHDQWLIWDQVVLVGEMDGKT